MLTVVVKSYNANESRSITYECTMKSKSQEPTATKKILKYIETHGLLLSLFTLSVYDVFDHTRTISQILYCRGHELRYNKILNSCVTKV